MDSFRRDPGETSERGAKRPRLPAVFEEAEAGDREEGGGEARGGEGGRGEEVVGEEGAGEEEVRDETRARVGRVSIYVKALCRARAARSRVGPREAACWGP